VGVHEQQGDPVLETSGRATGTTVAAGAVAGTVTRNRSAAGAYATNSFVPLST